MKHRVTYQREANGYRFRIALLSGDAIYGWSAGTKRDAQRCAERLIAGEFADEVAS